MNKVIINDIGYKIYYSNELFFVDLGKPIIHSYKTLYSAMESLYYAEKIDAKPTKEQINNLLKEKGLYYKKYRIDTFVDKNHIVKYFDTINEALDNVPKYGVTFLLEHILNGKYDILEQIN